MIKIDLKNTYEIEKLTRDFSVSTFYTELKNGKKVELQISILKNSDIHLIRMYNLAFGPLNESGEIDDNIVLQHTNIEKVFSTILMVALAFLELH